MLRAAVAAGHPATTQAGVEILEAGGSAADAAVAACLASCVAETVMTGLLGGGHAIYWDAASGRARLLDCFCAVPSGRGGELLELEVPFGEELVHYAVGAASCAVPGVPAGLDALWREHGRLPWADLCAPALRLAREGVPMPPAHVACLEMLEPVMTMREGARIYAPEGRLLRPGELLEQPGLVARARGARRRGRRQRLRRARSPSRCSHWSTNATVSSRAPTSPGTRPSGRSRPRCPTQARASSPAAAWRASSRRSRRCRRSATEPGRTLDPAGRARRRARAGDAHDQPRHDRRRRERVRPDDQPRPRLRRLATGARSPSEQHARRGRPARRRARRRASGCRA